MRKNGKEGYVAFALLCMYICMSTRGRNQEKSVIERVW